MPTATDDATAIDEARLSGIRLWKHDTADMPAGPRWDPSDWSPERKAGLFALGRTYGETADAAAVLAPASAGCTADQADDIRRILHAAVGSAKDPFPERLARVIDAVPHRHDDPRGDAAWEGFTDKAKSDPGYMTGKSSPVVLRAVATTWDMLHGPDGADRICRLVDRLDGCARFAVAAHVVHHPRLRDAADHILISWRDGGPRAIPRLSAATLAPTLRLMRDMCDRDVWRSWCSERVLDGGERIDGPNAGKRNGIESALFETVLVAGGLDEAAARTSAGPFRRGGFVRWILDRPASKLGRELTALSAGLGMDAADLRAGIAARGTADAPRALTVLAKLASTT